MELRPNMVKFITFDDVLPSEIPFAEFTEDVLKTSNEIVYNLATLADIDFDNIHSADRQIKENETEKAAGLFPFC